MGRSGLPARFSYFVSQYIIHSGIHPGNRSCLYCSILLLTTPLPCTSQDMDLNQYYRYPLAIAAAYQPLSGIGNSRLLDFQINEVTGEIRLPLPGHPVFQPFIKAGVLDFSFLMEPDYTGLDWTHRHVYGALGFGISHRFSRDFELGFDLFAGASQSLFTRLESAILDASDDYGQLNLVSGSAGSFSINPSYNFSIAVKPSVRYLLGLGPLDSYDGFSYGLGLQAAYRFGQDPDRASAAIRALRFGDISMPPVFAAMRSYYAQQPITSFEIENVEKFEVEDVVVEFFQEGFMDSPTTLAHFERLAKGERQGIDLKATFSEAVFSTQGVTPLNGELIVSYTARGRSAEQRRSLSYELYDRNALTWSDDRKVAAFITPADGSVRNYASFILLSHREVKNPYISDKLQFAMQAYNALAELGILYQIDPTSPFTMVQENAVSVDSISFPRETLVRLTGDCDDLTVLYNTILESSGIATAFVTVPGHIYSAVNTGIPSRSFASVHPDRNMLVEIDGEIWVLVEITLIGKGSFEEAWSTGIGQYREYESKPASRGFYITSEAHRIFRPVALRETDLGLQYGDKDAMVSRFRQDLASLSRATLQTALKEAETRNSARYWNKYGITAAKYGFTQEAIRGFEQAQALDPKDFNAKLNLGSTYFLDKKYQAARDAFLRTLEMMDNTDDTKKSTRFTVLLNLSRTYYALENYSEARDFLSSAERINPEEARQYSFLAGTAEDSSARASDTSAAQAILFFED